MDLLARLSEPVASPHSLSVGFLLALLLAGAILGGYAARLVKVPRVVGYLLAGVALRFALTSAYADGEQGGGGPALFANVAEPLQIIKSLGLGLIMFVMGNVFDVRHLKSVGRRVLKLSVLEAACVLVLVGGACSVVWMLSAGEARMQGLAAGLLLGAVAVATAPAATLLVLQEYDAKGPVSDTILTMTAINNTVSIVLFHVLFLVFTATGVIVSGSTATQSLWLDLSLTVVGSAVLGGALGFLFSVLHAKVPLAEFLLVLFAALVGLGAGAQALSQSLNLSYNFLLTCLFMGAVFTNITLDSGPLYNSLAIMGAPIFAAFFVIAGYDLHLTDLGHLGMLGGLYVGLRIAGKYVGTRWGARWARWSGELSPHVGLGLLCQAGVAIGLADFLAGHWSASADGSGVAHPLALHFKTIVLGSVVVFELIGPLVLKSVAKSAGEVKAITLLRRRKPAAMEGDSVTKLTGQALWRTLGLGKSKVVGDPHQLCVRDIMRSNVKFIRDSARLDAVLHYVEASRYNHFPVVDEQGAFVGMIHFGDLRDMLYDPHMRDLVTAVDLACPDDMVPAGLPLDDLLEKFKTTDVGSLVVVESTESRRVVGLVEQRDMLRALHGAGTRPA